jgi:hypothetical protein
MLYGNLFLSWSSRNVHNVLKVAYQSVGDVGAVGATSGEVMTFLQSLSWRACSSKGEDVLLGA